MGMEQMGMYLLQSAICLYEKAGPAKDCSCHIDVLGIAGNTAVARVVIKNWHGMDFVDFHELIRENGEWKIIARTCQQIL